MSKLLLLSSLYLLFLYACTGPAPAAPSAPAKAAIQQPALPGSSDTLANGQQWLQTTIETYFNKYDSLKGDFAAICTPDFAAFQQAITNAGMDGGFSIAEIRKKWPARPVEQAGTGTGFLISGQDFGTITVPRCLFIRKTTAGHYIYAVSILDRDFKITYFRSSLFPKEIIS
ncbi:hypothetical protein [Niabella sp.]|uniref:hypothetical protein n=1 Tax=Niabella sp. TaxID=1962976 RepID=UPI00261052A2|nr:hypothetical protein [Niabella sp.]